MPEREAPVGTGGDRAAIDVARAEPQLAHEQPQLGARHGLAGGVAQDPAHGGAVPQPTVLVGRRTPTCLRALPRPRKVWPGKPATRRAPSPPPEPLTGPRAVTAKGVETVWLPPASVTRSSSVRLPAIAGDAAIVSFFRSGHGRGLVKSQRAFCGGRCRVVVLGRDDRRVRGVGHVDDLGAADADVVGRAEGHRLVARARAGREQALARRERAEGRSRVVGDRDARADRARAKTLPLRRSQAARRPSSVQQPVETVMIRAPCPGFVRSSSRSACRVEARVGGRRCAGAR